MIRPPTINLARRPFRNNTLHYAVFGTCLGVLLLASVYNVYDFVRTGGELGRLEADRADRAQVYMALRDEVESMKKDIAALNLKTLDAKSSFANGLILSRLFSWSTLFDRMEDLIPPEVRIRSIRPSISTKGIEIQLDGLARSAEPMYEFERNLADSDFFLGVYPESENTRESKTEINFDLVMRYIPAGKPGSASASPPSPIAGLPQPEAVEEAAVSSTESPAGSGDGSGNEGVQKAIGTEATDAVAAGSGTPHQETGSPTPPSSAPSTAAAVTPGQVQAPAPPPAQPPAPVVNSAPIRPAVGMGVTIQTSEAKSPTRPLTQYTNKEFFDTYGETKFMRMRGGFAPLDGSGQDARLTNQEYIQKYGLEKFLADRGGLDRSQQKTGGGQ